MNRNFEVTLPSSVLSEKIELLFPYFSELCNFISSELVENKCFNRVVLHHLVYAKARDRFPRVGSQLICNAIHSVLFTYKLVYQTNALLKVSGTPNFRRILFKKDFPVLMDLHTVSLKSNFLSVYALDGRLAVPVPGEINKIISRNLKYIKEVLLVNVQGGVKFLFICDTNKSAKTSAIVHSVLDFANV